MYFSDRITLRHVLVDTDDDGYKIETYQDTEVWADKKSVTRSEFYAANANGINIAAVFVVHSEDYQNQTDIIELDGKRYEVIRAYQKGIGSVELMCSDKAVK